MKTKLVLEGRDGSWILPHGSIQWITKKRGAASQLIFETPSLLPSFSFGSRLRLTGDNLPLFTGYVFKTEQTSESIRLTAYDGLRYFLYYDTKVFEGRSASQIADEILRERGFPIGTLEDSSYVIPLLAADNRTYLDMIEEASERTRQASGEDYLFYADGEGKFCFQNSRSRILPFRIHPAENLENYQISSGIDGGSFNRIRLLQEDRRKNLRNVQEVSDPEREKEWGVLQYFQRADASLNEAQILEQARKLLQEKNHPQKRILLNRVLGNAECRAGCSVWTELSGELQLCMIEEAVHWIDGENYYMRLSVRQKGG